MEVQEHHSFTGPKKRHHTLDSKFSPMDAQWKQMLQQEKVTDPIAYAYFMLEKVSRTFALNIQTLSPKLRFQVLLSYLFCRIADTLEDDNELTPEIKINLLKQFSELFTITPTGNAGVLAFVNQLPQSWKNSDKWDHLLTYHSSSLFSLYFNLPDPVKKSITMWVKEMCDGMALFTKKQLLESNKPLIQTTDELDKYCYYVAGTVGNLLCDLFYLQSPFIGKVRYKKLKEKAVSFGLGLQLTNILKDVNEDLSRNILFLPHSLLKTYKLSKKNLALPENKQPMKEISRELIKKALNHLEDALDYTCGLPRLEPRIRLFCLWPLFMALETLILLSKTNNSLSTGYKIKITRLQVKDIIKKTSLIWWSNRLLTNFFNKRKLALHI